MQPENESPVDPSSHLQDKPRARRFTIDYSSIGIRLGDSAEKPITPSNDTNVVVDTGTTFTKLNPSVVQPIFEALDAKYNASQGYATVDCEKRSMSGGIVFGFGKTKITVSFADFIIQASADLCIMGLMPLADGNQQILGDSFMRSAFGKSFLLFIGLVGYKIRSFR